MDGAGLLLGISRPQSCAGKSYWLGSELHVSCQVSRNACHVELQQSFCLLAAPSTEPDSSRVFCVLLCCPRAGAGMVGSSPGIFSFSAAREYRDCLGG